MATEKQMLVLKAIRFNDFGNFNGAKELPAGYIFNGNDWDVWSNCIDCCDFAGREALPKGKALAAVVSTLVQAGLASSDGECVRLTQAGFDAVQAA